MYVKCVTAYAPASGSSSADDAGGGRATSRGPNGKHLTKRGGFDPLAWAAGQLRWERRMSDLRDEPANDGANESDELPLRHRA